MEETIAYNKNEKGFPSRYSFIPEAIVALNNFMYTFKGGNIYKHNSNPIRNNFYDEQFTSIVTTVFNEGPTMNKLFQTLKIDGSHPWDAVLVTDIQTSGHIDSGWFEKKEGEWYAFIRNTETIPLLSEDLASRSVNGIGKSTTITPAGALTTATFALTVNITKSISVGDLIYYSVPPYTTPLVAGKVTAVNVDLPNSINEIIFDTTFDPSTTPIGIQDPFLFFVKNSVAESKGVLGAYTEVTLENDSTEEVELFVIESELMQSLP